MFIRSRHACFSLLLLFVSSLWAAEPTRVEHDHAGILLEEVARGLGVPWGMAFVTPRKLLISQRSGQVRLLDLETLRITDIDGAPGVFAEGQGGLLDIAVGPDHGPEGWIYLTYSKPVDGSGATTLARARLQHSRLVDWQDLLVTDSVSDSRRHFGSRIAFDDRGHVYFGVGDRGDRDQAQHLGNHIGAIMRLRLDGGIPADNPFVDVAGARPEIWSYGHRNPQGLLFDRPSGRLWSNEHGPRGGDEINLVEKGLNYGWPVISYGKEYWAPIAVGEGTHRRGMEQPVLEYTPSIAPGSLLLYRGDAFPEWRGNLFAGALKLTHLNRVTLSADGKAIDEDRLFESLHERIRALAEDPQGWLYLSTDSGRILRLRPTE